MMPRSPRAIPAPTHTGFDEVIREQRRPKTTSRGSVVPKRKRKRKKSYKFIIGARYYRPGSSTYATLEGVNVGPPGFMEYNVVSIETGVVVAKNRIHYKDFMEVFPVRAESSAKIEHTPVDIVRIED